jgi:DNA-binding NarL/FixJ family response regulator
MSVPTRKTVFIVDAMAFRRARLESFLRPWAANENAELISLDPDEAHQRLVDRNECDMLVYNVGAPASTYEVFTEVQVLHTLRRQAPLAIVSDNENPATVIAVMRSGAQAYFGNSMPPDLALQAFSFVLHGGTYFPPNAIMAGAALAGGFPADDRQQELSQEQPLQEAEQRDRAPSDAPSAAIYERQPSTVFDARPTGLRLGHGTSGVRPPPEFTDRQYAVLTCLCLGDPNKVIGRKLGMTETTVKVHVREIMRKLGVCNRTQVAIAAARSATGNLPDGVVEIIPLESTATVKSSAPN